MNVTRQKRQPKHPTGHLLRLTSVDCIFFSLTIRSLILGETSPKGDGKFKFIHQTVCRTSPISQWNINNGQSVCWTIYLWNFSFEFFIKAIWINNLFMVRTYIRPRGGLGCLSYPCLNLTNRMIIVYPIKNATVPKSIRRLHELLTENTQMSGQ